jgi:hypothetical protein
MSVTSQGIISTFEQFIPKVTSLLTWIQQNQVYSTTLAGPFTPPQIT